MRIGKTVSTVALVLMVCGVVRGQGVTFSVDFQGPTAVGPGPAPGVGLPEGFGLGTTVDEGSILTPALPGPPGPNPPSPGPLPTPGVMVGSTGGAVGSVPGGLGIVPSALGGVEVDALSYGRDIGSQVFFSVDEHAIGLPAVGPPEVFSEGSVGTLEASADVFVYVGPFGPVPPGPVFGNVAIIDGNGIPPFGGPGLGLLEPNPPTPGTTFDQGDNLDALDMDTVLADVTPLSPIFFSLDSSFADPLEGLPANLGSALANGFSGADVLVSTPGGVPALYAPGPVLGLDIAGGAPDTDDLDALVLFDNGDVVFTPGVDRILFSVRRGSAVIGVPDSAFGVPIEEGDILTLPAAAGAPPSIFIPAEALGLATIRSGAPLQFPFGDELDALDIVPEPSSVVLLSLGALLLSRKRRESPPAR